MKDNFEASVKSGITPEPSFIRKHDEIVTKVIKKTREKAVKTLSLLLLTVAAAIWFSPVVAVVLGIATAVSLFVLVCTGQRMPTSFLREIYEEGLLTSGMIVKTQPLTIGVLANLTARDGEPENYGCFFQQVQELPGMKGELYEKLPCASMFRYQDGAYHSCFQPHPLCWGTSNRQEIEDALRTLEGEQEDFDSFEVIKGVAEQFPSLPDEYIVRLDQNLQPTGLKHYMEDEFKPYISDAMNGNYQKTEQTAEHLPEEMPVIAEFNRLMDLALKHQVYDYVSRPCMDGDYPFHNNPGFYTYLGDGAGFLATERKRKLALEDGDVPVVPLIGGNILLTTKGCFRKKERIPWDQVNMETRINTDGEIEVLINGDLTAVMPCHMEEYVNHDVFQPQDIVAIREIERQRIQSFLEDVKSSWGLQ